MYWRCSGLPRCAAQLCVGFVVECEWVGTDRVGRRNYRRNLVTVARLNRRGHRLGPRLVHARRLHHPVPVGLRVGPVPPCACHTLNPQAPAHDRLLRVQSVFGFVEYHRMRTVHDGVGDFLIAVCGQAVHEQGTGIGLVHQGSIDLIGS